MRTFPPNDHGLILHHDITPSFIKDKYATQMASQRRPSLPPIATPQHSVQPEKTERTISYQTPSNNYPNKTPYQSQIESDEHQPTENPYITPNTAKQLNKSRAEQPMQAPPVVIVRDSPPSNPANDYYMQSLLQRLSENEHVQKMLMVETTKLHSELNESFRIHDGILRDEVQMRRTLEDHFEFMKSVVKNMQDQLTAVTQQLTIEREATRHQFSILQQMQVEQRTSFKEMQDNQEKELARQSMETAILRKSLENIVQTIQPKIEALVKQSIESSGLINELSVKSQSHDNTINMIGSQVSQVQQKIGDLSNDSQENIKHFSKALEDCIVLAKQSDEEQKQIVLQDIGGRVETSLKSLFALDEERQKKDEERYQQLNVNIDEKFEMLQKNMVPAQRIDAIETELSSTNAKLDQDLLKIESTRLKQNQALLQVVSALKDSLSRAKVDERAALKQFDARLKESMNHVETEILMLQQYIDVQLKKTVKPLILMT